MFVASAWAACSSPAAYTRGRMPAAALPEAEVSVVRRPRSGPPEPLSGALDLDGTLVAADRGEGPGGGFRLAVREADGAVVSVEVRTWTGGVPDLAGDEPITVAIRPGPVVRVADAAGPAALVHAGPTPPPAGAGDPIRVRGTPDRTWVEVASSEALCRWTWVHGTLEVETDGERHELPPGATRVLAAAGRHWLVAAGDWRVPEESDCGAAGEPRLRFVWLRLSPQQAASVRGTR